MKITCIIAAVVLTVCVSGLAWGIDEDYGSSRTTRTDRAVRPEWDRTYRTNRTNRPQREYELENVPANEAAKRESREKSQTVPVKEW